MNENKKIWVWVTVRGALIFLPLFMAVLWLVLFNNGNDSLLSFNQIHDNVYIVNNVLLAFIVASYFVVFLGLCLYFVESIRDLNSYRGDSNTVKSLNTVSLISLAVALVALILYLAIIYITCSGSWSESTHEYFDIETIVQLNKFLSLVIFSIFLVADLLAWKSQSLQKKENQRRVDAVPDDRQLKHLMEHISNQIQFSRHATFLINVPTLLLTASMVVLTSYISGGRRFWGKVDHHLHFMEVKDAVEHQIFVLFLNGLEAGVIVSTIIYSQLIYMIIRTNLELKDRNLPSPQALPSENVGAA